MASEDSDESDPDPLRNVDGIPFETHAGNSRHWVCEALILVTASFLLLLVRHLLLVAMHLVMCSHFESDFVCCVRCSRADDPEMPTSRMPALLPCNADRSK